MPTAKEVEAARSLAISFFDSPYFAVVGASTKPAKFGHQGMFLHSATPYELRLVSNFYLPLVYTWYKRRGLPVTPINPSSAEIQVDGKTYPTIPDILDLPNPTKTSVSFITQPEVTLETLKKAKEIGVPAVWLQPGSFNDEVLKYASEEFKSAVAGRVGSRAHDGWCVLVDGEAAASAAGKKLKL